MDRIERNPHLDECPDYSAAPFLAVRNALTTQNNITDEQATQQLTDAWKQHNNGLKTIWDQQVRADQQAQEEQDRLTREEEELRQAQKAQEEEAEK
jgi:hypothetical protein